MENILSYIGSFASIGSVPLAIYLYLKSRENKMDEVRRQILKVISYQIGENRKLSAFEIDKVIKSNIRNNKLPSNSISQVNILEDLVSDTISSPLVNATRKDEILENIREIFPSINMAIRTVEKLRISSAYASVMPIMLFIPLGITLFVGENGWNTTLSWWFSFNAIEGYLPNLIFSFILAILGLVAIFILSKVKGKLNKIKEEDDQSSANSSNIQDNNAVEENT